MTPTSEFSGAYGYGSLGPWVTYDLALATFTAAAGTFTGVTGTFKYQKTGKTVNITINITGTTSLATANVAMTVPQEILPNVTPNTFGNMNWNVGATVGAGLLWANATDGKIYLQRDRPGSGTFPAGTLVASGQLTYEVAA